MAQKSLWSTWILLPHWKLIQWMMKYWFKAVEHCSNCENSCCWGIGSERVFFQNCQLFDFASSWETSIIAQKDTMICFNLLRCHIQHISSFHKTPFTLHDTSSSQTILLCINVFNVCCDEPSILLDCTHQPCCTCCACHTHNISQSALSQQSIHKLVWFLCMRPIGILSKRLKCTQKLIDLPA